MTGESETYLNVVRAAVTDGNEEESALDQTTRYLIDRLGPALSQVMWQQPVSYRIWRICEIFARWAIAEKDARGIHAD